MLTYELVDSPAHPLVPTARQLFREYAGELGIDLSFQDFQSELDFLPEKYGPPLGRLYVLLNGNDPVGCGALRDLGAGACEIKRLYLRRIYRRKGYGRALSERLMEDAREIGYKTVRLDTLRRLMGALEMYQGMGFDEIPPYNYNPQPDIVYLERRL